MTTGLEFPRRLWRRFCITLICISCVSACSEKSSQAATAPGAELLLVNGQVYTVDPQSSWAEAIAIRDGRIIWVGPNNEHAGWVDANTRIVDLQGKMVLPGFQDAHTHPVSGGVGYLQCALFDINGIDELLATVTQCAADNPEAEWILGGGWLMDNFPGGLPDKKLLDAIVADRPVALESSDGHSLWVNSRALALAGINRASIDPAGGRIDRYPDSREPSGGLQEPSAMNLVLDLVPAITEQEKLAGLIFARDMMNSFGITAVQDASVKLGGGDSYSGLEAYRTLAQQGGLNLHVVTALHWQEGVAVENQLPGFEEARDHYSVGDIQANTIKIFQDGVIETHTSALIEPYLDRKDGYRGELLNTQEALDQAVLALDRAGFQIHFHAIGDLAIRSSLDALERAREKNGPRDSRHHISHLELFDPADIPRFRELEVVANFQPLWAMNDSYITELTVPIIGTERSRWLYPMGSLQRAGATIAFGSDWSVSSANPLEGIEVAVTRLDPFGATSEPLGENEEISLADAIRYYTLNSAYVNFLDKDTGSIEVGKLADLVVLDRNLFEIAPAQISDARVEATLFGGLVVYGSLD